MGDSVDGLLTEVARQSLWADRIEKELQMTEDMLKHAKLACEELIAKKEQQKSLEVIQ